MIDSQATTNNLEMRWSPTTDETGRTYMEARWVVVDAEQPAAAVAA